jgi:iron complex outermembrane receptor protein
MKSIFILLALLGASTPGMSYAQAIVGTVTDAESHSPLPGAAIYIPGLDRGAISDDEGNYRVELSRAGVFRVVYQFLGFQTETRTVEAGAVDLVVHVALRPSTLETAPVTITARSSASDMLSTPQPVSILELSELRLNSGAAALDALDTVPGIRMAKSGLAVSKPVVRGLSGQRVLVVEDGIRQEGQQWGQDHGPELDGFAIQKIEVVKGPSSLLYGSDALGGVIQAFGYDIFSTTKRLQGQLGTVLSSNPGLRGANLRLSGRKDGFVYSGGMSYKDAGAYSNPRSIVPNSAFEELNVAMSLGMERAAWRSVADFKVLTSDMGLFEPDLLDHIDHGAQDEIGEPFQRVNHRKINWKTTGRWNGHRVELQASWQQNSRKEFEEEHEEGEEGHHDEATEAHDGSPALFLKLDSYTTDLRFFHRPMGRAYGSVGVSLSAQTNRTLGEETLIPSANIRNVGMFFTEEILFSDITLSGGARFDLRKLESLANQDLELADQSRSYRAFSGALGAAWHPRSDFSFSMNLGRAWRAPVLIELFGNGIHHGSVRFEQGRSDLNVERGLSLDGLVRWITPHIHVEASLFANRISDFIYLENSGTLDPGSGFPVYVYNQADALLKGGEFSLEWHPHPIDWLHLAVSGDRIRGENRGTKSDLPFMPADRLSFEVALLPSGFGTVSDLQIKVGPSIVAKQERVAENEAPSEGYWTWDASVGGSLEWQNVTLQPSIRVTNLLDSEYADHLNAYRKYGLLNQGRNVQFQLTVHL